MKKIFLFIFTAVLFVGNPVLAQNQISQATKKNVHEYFLFIKGVNAKSDVRLLEKNISTQKGVTFFMANRFPVRYFQLKSDRMISKDEFASWITGATYTLSYFGEGAKALEQILIDRKKAL